MTIKQLSLSIFLIVLGTMSACSNLQNQGHPISLQQQQLLQNQKVIWQVTQIQGHTISQEERAHLPYLRFDAQRKQVNGSDGCNHIFGSYQIQGETLHLSPLASTKMLCIDTMQISDQFHLALSQVDRFEIDHQVLKLKDQSNHIIMQLESRTHLQ